MKNGRAMRADVEKISPTRAAEYLKKNANFRRPNKRKIDGLVRDIRGGLWEDNGESIKFADGENGEELLVDGQNRLRAIIDAKQTLPLVVIRGLQSADFVDMGERRTLPQYLAHHGHPYAAQYAAAVSNIAWYESCLAANSIGQRPQITQAERVKLFEKHYSRLKKLIPPLWNQYNKMRWRSTVAAVMCLGSNPRGYAGCKTEFMEYLHSGEGMEKTDPVFLLREHIADEVRRHTHSAPGYRLALTIKAWNAHREGLHISKLTFKPTGPTAEDFPRIN